MGLGAGRFTLVECARCGFLYLSPRPDMAELSQYYPPDYAFYQTPIREDRSAFSRATREYGLAKRCALVLKQRQGGDLLDVGAAIGDFLAAMRSHSGWRVRGLELDAGAAARARQVYGLTVDCGDLGHVSYQPESFDIVTLWEVLEHLPQPLDALRQIHSLLRPGGAVVMSMPNREALAAKVFGPAWIGLDVPRHFSVFSPGHVARALLESGFAQPLIFTPRGRLGAAHNGLLCGLASTHFWLGGDGAPNAVQRYARGALERLATRPAAVISLFLVTLPFSCLLRLVGRGTQMMVVARKP
jgi:SAM-dependent methyltransferase